MSTGSGLRELEGLKGGARVVLGERSVVFLPTGFCGGVGTLRDRWGMSKGHAVESMEWMKMEMMGT